MSTNENLPPYPRLGEIYRALSVSLGTKGSNRDVDQLARKGEFDWALLPALVNELIIAPLGKYVDSQLADLVGQSLAHLHASYINLVSTVPLDSLSRRESLPLLVEHYFSLHALGLIYGIKKDFGGPDLLKLLDPDLHPVAVVLAWLDEGEPIPLAKVAHPKTTDTDRHETEKYRKWTKGEDLPDRQSITRLASTLKAAGIDDGKIENVRRWLIVARSLAELEKEAPLPFRGAMRRHLLLGMPDFDIGRVLSIAVIESAKQFSALTEPALMLYERLKRTTEKAVGDQGKLKADLDEFEVMTSEVDPEGRTRFHIHWMRGRWHALSGDFTLALNHYERAVELANYRAGDQQKRIVEETLALAGHLRKKAALKRLKHQAVAFGLFADPRSDAVIEDWEIDQFNQHFYQIFPTQGLFPEALADEVDGGHLPFLVFDEEDVAQIKLDRRNPDRIITIRLKDGQVRRWPQLRFFASFNQPDSVRTLLELGASVDRLDESGGSALLCAIQGAAQTGDRRVLEMLLTCPHSGSVLDSITAKKHLTPLLCAVDLGEPDVIETLLAMGATADLRGNIVGQTPLYYALESLGALVTPGKFYHYLHQRPSADPDLVEREVLRRYNVRMAGVFGDGALLQNLRELPENARLFERLIAAMVAEKIERRSAVKFIRIIELLLDHGANPNASHRYPEPGRTPMMLAAENNSMLAFDLMLRYGGNPYQTDAAGMDCLRIAMAFHAFEVIGHMRRKGIM